nr:MAG TPA: nonstructural protein [Caudoviricetes sp.]
MGAPRIPPSLKWLKDRLNQDLQCGECGYAHAAQLKR